MTKRLVTSVALALFGAFGMASAADVAAPCPADCGGCQKVCKPVPDKKKTTKTIYDCKCVDFCLPKCSLSGHHDCCDGAGCPQCERPRTRKVLIKKTKSVETDSFKCVVETVAAPTGCYAPYHPVHGHAAPPVSIPLPQAK